MTDKLRQTSSILAKLFPPPSKMKNALAFLIVLKSRNGYLRNLNSNYRKKCDKQNAPNLKIFGKTTVGTLPNQERFSLFTVLKSRDVHVRNLQKRITEKNVTDEIFQTLTFLAKLLPATSHIKNVLAFSAAFRSRDGHMKNLKNDYRKKGDRWNTSNLKIFGKNCPKSLRQW